MFRDNEIKCLTNELKLAYHYILSYIYITFIVHHNKWRIVLKTFIKLTNATV